MTSILCDDPSGGDSMPKSHGQPSPTTREIYLDEMIPIGADIGYSTYPCCDTWRDGEDGDYYYTTGGDSKSRS